MKHLCKICERLKSNRTYFFLRTPLNGFHSTTSIRPIHSILKSPQYRLRGHVIIQPVRNMTGLRLIGGIISRFAKLRYLFFTGAVGGGYAANQTYESWKSNLPDLAWLKEYFPDSESFDAFSNKFKDLTKDLNLPNMSSFTDKLPTEYPNLQKLKKWLEGTIASEQIDTVSDITNISTIHSLYENSSEQRTQNERINLLNEQMLKMQGQYQKEMDRLTKENQDLRRSLLLRSQSNDKKKKMKRSLIDMYSEVLDELGDFDSSYDAHDHLPRVVVIGDQSSGKTSVLEMIMQARVFPRGSGEMMTRSPVKVTLSEGPYHIANFKGSNREYDLTKEKEMDALRKEIEKRMRASVNRGETVSNETISLTVKGPGLPRMVLVDLPGIISTVTTGMAIDTRDRIRHICKQHMVNPNAIILCIQDGSIDAERSNVTDLVSSIDPTGRRTIFVMTKIDLAESNQYNPDRIKKILEGRLFPMKALGYFAVVTGKGNSNDSIQTIKDYEESFFRNSKLFSEGVLKAGQMTTANLSLAVSKCFWKMVRESIDQQADAFKAARYNLETEWKNIFPKQRILDRDELFEKGRSEVLDDVISLSQVPSQKWEEIFEKRIWQNMSDHLLEEIYLPASQTPTPGHFNTMIDIKMKQWMDALLPLKCIEVGLLTLQEEFLRILKNTGSNKSSSLEKDPIFFDMKMNVCTEAMKKHEWDGKATDSLKVIQSSAFEDTVVGDKLQWDNAVKFMENSIDDKLLILEEEFSKQRGPGKMGQWLKWQYLTNEQKAYEQTVNECERMMKLERKGDLTNDDLTAIRKNLESRSIDVEEPFIRDTWWRVYKLQSLRKAKNVANECRKAYYHHIKGFNAEGGANCTQVVFFWRLQKLIQATSKALRQQLVNIEAGRLERNVKETLEEVGNDPEKLKVLLKDKRVTLAEELKRVQHIQELLEEFIKALNSEKN